jgi:hypothetical protein
MNSNEGVWLTIVDYSKYKNVSISTIRRHIKSEILRYKDENGKYLIFVPSSEKLKLKEDSEILKLKLHVEELKQDLKRIKEENNELKMLVDLYESNNQVDNDIPSLPKIV